MTTALLPRGSRFGDIKLTGYVGSGGFSDVYAGEDPSGRRLAVKVLRLAGLEQEAQSIRIEREREALSKIDSRGVAKLVSANLSAEQPWIASEFIDGPTLQESIDQDGPLSYEETLSLTRRLAEIVAELHARGVAHRDITPNNVIFGPDGPVLIDFGSARIDLESSATGSILLAGTPGFVPPEAEAGLTVGRMADVYALGRLAAHCSGERALPDILLRAVLREPSSRPEAQEVADTLASNQELINRSRSRTVAQLPRRISLTTLALSVEVRGEILWVAPSRRESVLVEILRYQRSHEGLAGPGSSLTPVLTRN